MPSLRDFRAMVLFIVGTMTLALSFALPTFSAAWWGAIIAWVVIFFWARCRAFPLWWMLVVYVVVQLCEEVVL